MATLDGKAVVVTGAGRGIGAAIAREAARAGARVIVNDIDRAEAEQVASQIARAGGQAVPLAADISDWNAARTLADCCLDSFGRIDGLVNNAALFRLGRVEEMTESDLRDTMSANVLGTAFTARHAAPEMIKRRSGSIVNVTSGAHFGLVTQGAYGASKGAVASFTYTWAIELKEFNVRVNSLSPFGTTRMSQSSGPYYAAKGVSPRVLPPPEANAPVVVYLLSDESKAVTGQIVRIEGKDLSLVAHPGISLPTLTREAGWDVGSIARAFREEFSARSMPTGVVGLNVQAAPITRKTFD